jgi:hypothetical protein
MGHFEQTPLVGGRPGERSLYVAEELALDQVLRDGRTIDLDERHRLSLAVLVDRIRHQLLARAALPADEDVCPGARHFKRGADDFFDRRRVPDQGLLPVARLAQAKTLFECREFQTALHGHHDSLSGEWLFQEIEGADFYRFRRLGQRRIPGNEDRRDLEARRLNDLEELDAVDLAEFDVENH